MTALAPLVGAMPLREVRPRLAEALAPVEDSDPELLEAVVDSLEPPALVLDWDTPWLVPLTVGMGPGLWTANIAVLCVAGRTEPAPNIEALEQLIGYTVRRLREDPYPWPVVNSQPPLKYPIGGVTYLGARLILAPKITIEEA